VRVEEGGGSGCGAVGWRLLFMDRCKGEADVSKYCHVLHGLGFLRVFLQVT
jgi:hypothetical protein